MKKDLNIKIEEILQNFFSASDTEEFKSFYSSSEIQPQKEAEKDSAEYKSSNGLNFRTQADVLITFASNRLSKEKLIPLMLLLNQYAITSGEFSTAIEISEKIISLSQDDGSLVDIMANAHLSLGEIFSRQAAWENSFDHVHKARELFDSVKDKGGIAKSDNLLGTVYGDLGDLKQALELFESALAIVAEDKNYALTGKIEINLGIIYSIQGKFDTALSYYKRALLNFEKINDFMRIAEIHQNLGIVYTKKEEYKFAIQELDYSLDAAFKTNYLQVIGFVYLSKAFIYSQLRDYSLANGFADKAMEIAYKLNDKLTIAEVYKIKGIIQRNMKNYTSAENFLLTSLRLNSEAGNQLNFAETSNELGILYKEMGNFAESEKRFNEALEYFKKIDAEPEIVHIERALKLIR